LDKEVVAVIVFVQVNRKIITLIIGVIGLLIAGGTVFYGLQPVDRQASQARVINIPQGASTAEIAKLLAEEKVIRNPLLFRILTRIERLDNKLQAGEYELAAGMTSVEVLHKVALGETASYAFTIPEGFTVEQIAFLLADKKLADRERFLALARKGNTAYNLPNTKSTSGYAIEGFLFPDTYHVPKGMKEEEIIALMLKKFDATVTEEMRAKASSKGLTLRQLITLASVVEREAKSAPERPVIAAVFLRRLRIEMPLQSCATIQYILGTPKKELTVQDTKIESPYNTYLHPGLPPGPIGNPGLASLLAVLNPADTDVLYFVAKPDGTHIFSKSYAEHLQAIERASK
jgi:UPF0755 protein